MMKRESEIMDWKGKLSQQKDDDIKAAITQSFNLLVKENKKFQEPRNSWRLGTIKMMKLAEFRKCILQNY
jgi:hypothetical protein